MSIDDLLIQLRDEPDLQIRRYIPDKLAKLGNWKSTEPLGNLIIDSLQPVVMRNEAVESLGKQGDPRAIPYLAQVLDDSEDDIRRTSVWSLGQIGTPETIPYIFSRIDDTWVETRRWVAKAAGRVRSPEVIDPLLQYYRTIDPVKDQRVFADIVRAFRSQIHYLSDQQLSQLTRSFETLLTEDLQGSVLQALILFLLDAYRLGITPSRDILHQVYQTRNQNDPLVRPHLIIGLGYANDLEFLQNQDDIYAITAMGAVQQPQQLLSYLEKSQDDELIAALNGVLLLSTPIELPNFIDHPNLTVVSTYVAIHGRYGRDIDPLRRMYQEGKLKYAVLETLRHYGAAALEIFAVSSRSNDKVERQTTVQSLLSEEMQQHTDLHDDIENILLYVVRNERIWHIRRDARIGLEQITRPFHG